MKSFKKISLTLFLSIFIIILASLVLAELPEHDATDGTPWDSCTWACELGLRECKNACSDSASITDDMFIPEIAEIQAQVQQCQFDCVIPYESCNDACNSFYKPYYDLPHKDRPSIEDYIKQMEDQSKSDTTDSDTDTDPSEPDPLDENGEGCPRQCSGNTLLENGRKDASGECIYNPTECGICVTTEGWPHCGETEEEQKDKLKLEIQKKIIVGQEECLKLGWAKRYVGVDSDESIDLDYEGTIISDFGQNTFTDCKVLYHFDIDKYDLENLDDLDQINDKLQTAFDEVLEKKSEEEFKQKRERYKETLEKEAKTEKDKQKQKLFLELSEDAVDRYLEYMYDSDEMMIWLTEVKYIQTVTKITGVFDEEESEELRKTFNEKGEVRWTDHGKSEILHKTRPDFVVSPSYSDAQNTMNKHFESYVKNRIAVHQQLIADYESGKRNTLPSGSEVHRLAWKEVENEDYQAIKELSPDNYEKYLENYYLREVEPRIANIVEDQYEENVDSFTSEADNKVRAKLFVFDMVHSK